MSRYAVVYAPEAVGQLEELLAFIAERRSPAVADRYNRAVVQTCERLGLFSLLGVVCGDIRPCLRVTYHKGRTVLAYAVDAETRTVSILGVLSGGLDLAGALGAGGEP